MIEVVRRRAADERNVLASVFLPRMRQGGVAGVVCTVGGDASCLCPFGLERPFESALLTLAHLAADAKDSDGAVAIAASAADVRSVTARDCFALVPSLEGALPLGDDLGRLETLYALGVRCFGLTWNSSNALASGLGVPDHGLSRLGSAALAEMNRLGIVIDVSHASPRTFWDVIAGARAPIIASHSNARSLCDHPRNLDDAQLDAVAATGGVVGVVFYPSFVGQQPVDAGRVADHIDYIADRIGAGHVVIGADFIDYAYDRIVEDLRASEAYEEIDDADLAYPRGLENCTSLARLLRTMRERGWSDEDVAGLAAENFLRVFDAVEAARPR